MRIRISLLALFLIFAVLSCYRKTDKQISFNGGSIKTGKVLVYQNKLQKAEKDLEKSKLVVNQYQERLFHEEIKVIKRRVRSCEEFFERNSFQVREPSFFQSQLSDLFIEEREILLSIMRSENTQLVREASDVLDHILRLITRLGTRRSE